MPRQVKRYPVHDSPFYKRRSRRLLARHLNATLPSLERLAKLGTTNYLIFPVDKGTNRERTVEVPKPKLDRIHRRIFDLLAQIEPPPYLHSGVKGRSYITNAHTHASPQPLVKLDIKKFYPSSNGAHVYCGLRSTFEVSPDVAGLLTNLSTVNNHIPTGSSMSQLLAYFVHKDLFDEIFECCEAHGYTMTCYVDDIAISGPGVNRDFADKIGRIIQSAGLEYHKVMTFRARGYKSVTGVGIRDGALVVPNRRQKLIVEELAALKSLALDGDLQDFASRLLSRLGEASQIESRMKKWSAHAKQLIREFEHKELDRVAQRTYRET